MSLRTRLHVYLVAIHLLFAILAGLLLHDRVVWLLVSEIVLAASVVAGIVLVRTVFVPLGMIRTGIDFIRENDFNTRFSERQAPELRELVRTYNAMMTRLREERIRNREQEQFLHDVIAESPSGIVTLDLEGRITSANPSAMALLGADGAAGIADAALAGIADAALAGRRLDELDSPLAGQLAGIEEGRSRVVRLQGRRRVRCSRSSFMDRGFRRQFVLLEELTEELHRTERDAYGKLIRMMSHEVNNTVGAVNSLLESGLAYGDQIAAPDRDDYRRALQVAIRRNLNMNEFMRGFADVIRLPPPRPRPVAIRSLVEEAVVLLGESAARAGVRWQWQIEEELPPVDVDPPQMEQVLLNVLQNGIDAVAAAGGGTITIRLGRRGRVPSVAIRDTGGGITPDVEEQLFAPFFTTRQDGQGIGLTMVQEILTAHGFDFALTNAAPGEAEFVICFTREQSRPEAC